MSHICRCRGRRRCRRRRRGCCDPCTQLHNHRISCGRFFRFVFLFRRRSNDVHTHTQHVLMWHYLILTLVRCTMFAGQVDARTIDSSSAVRSGKCSRRYSVHSKSYYSQHQGRSGENGADDNAILYFNKLQT